MRNWKSVLGTFISVVAIFLIVTYSACKKDDYDYIDECAEVNCQNGANCFKGDCLCPAGFSGDYCEEVWLAKYIGRWHVKQTIAVSNKDGRQFQESEYYINVSRDGNSNTRFLIDNIMGNDNYDGILCKVGVNPNGGPDVPTKFVFSSNQAINNSSIVLTTGSGSVDFLGQNMNGNFNIKYTELDSNAYGVLVQETITFTATFE